MNPMMGGMNPMMAMMGGMNPMMAMMGMMSNMANMGAGSSDGSNSISPGGVPIADQAPIDHRVKALCREFTIDPNTTRILHDVMKQREDYDEDIQALQMLVQRAVNKGKKPLDVMLSQIRAIKSGKFPGKDILDKDIWAFTEKYDLDDRVLGRLITTVNARPKNRKNDLQALDERLSSAQKPTGLGLLVRLLEGLEETGRLPSPPRRLGGSGAFRPTGTFLHPIENSRGRGSRDDRRSRSRHRSRSRGGRGGGDRGGPRR